MILYRINLITLLTHPVFSYDSVLGLIHKVRLCCVDLFIVFKVVWWICTRSSVYSLFKISSSVLDLWYDMAQNTLLCNYMCNDYLWVLSERSNRCHHLKWRMIGRDNKLLYYCSFLNCFSARVVARWNEVKFSILFSDSAACVAIESNYCFGGILSLPHSN
jgi:hypothetical protein